MNDSNNDMTADGLMKIEQETLEKAEAFYAENAKKAATMFGYPSRNVSLSPVTRRLLMMHYDSPFSNNCGDIDERGNYLMDTKQTEKKIVGLFAEKLGFGKDFWGYVTSGGTESNSAAVAFAFNKYPDGVLYYSQAAHYSVAKAAKGYRAYVIPADDKDRMDIGAFIEAAKKNYFDSGSPANVVLTFGTTQCGECDDIDEVIKLLDNEHIAHFVHVDAALFGGIPNDRRGAPKLTDLKTRGVDSACVSLHKYIGFPDVHSVFVATEKPHFDTIDYIGQHDTTVSGSRSIPAYALYNHISEQFFDKNEDEYIANVNFFEENLKAADVNFYRADKSNIFVIDCPDDIICKKYQLSSFFVNEGGRRVKKAHIIIFSHHDKQVMRQLIDDLK
ncbi:MAG: hypothetical protein ILP02_02385 [Clostridia bacterium]|nr:hypothetical protein [Clostridia bacterium]